MPLLDNGYAIVMAGGRGSRFWPASRRDHPKQFLKVFGDQSMLQITFDRITQLFALTNIYVVTEWGFKATIAEQLPELPKENILEEPMGRSTAAAVILATATILKEQQEATLTLIPSDHYINNLDQFYSCLTEVCQFAKTNDALCTIGVKPTAPETGYGYIQIKREEVGKKPKKIFKVKQFVEKPDLYTAIEYIKNGQFYWNSGIFGFSAKALMEATLCYMPKLFKGFERIRELSMPYRQEDLRAIYESLDNVSIDYGIMEKAENVFCMPGEFEWSDTGSWVALNKFIDETDDGNIIQGDVINIGCKNCILVGDNAVTGAINLRNLIVVSSKNGVLVCHKDNAQEVKKIVEQLELQKKVQYL
jgi:mannose-1-phosphate guanylyltransferase